MQSLTIENVNDNILGYDTSALEENRVVSFMGAKNFKLRPLLRLYTVWASGILGEPQYYRDSSKVAKYARSSDVIKDNSFMFPEDRSKTSNDVFMETLKDALDADFEHTLCFASILRNEYLMRLGPQVILVEASLHPNRAQFNENNPKIFRQVAESVIKIPTDLNAQMKYYKQKTGGCKGIPSILKTCWKDALERFSSYQYSKYATSSKMIDLIRLSHPRSKKNDNIAELVESGQVKTDLEDSTWEKLRSNGKSWREIIGILGKSFPHMALLRNLRGMSQELNLNEMTQVMKQLIKGVKFGKQFPFRYYTAYQQFDNTSQVANPLRRAYIRKSAGTPKVGDEPWKWKMWRKRQTQKNASNEFDVNGEITRIIKDGLEECMKVAISNLPQLEGRVVCLSDNSGSAWGAFQSEYGSQTVATIGNLSAIITAMNATEGGEVGIFGDKLHMYKVSKERGVIEQLNEINTIGQGIGQGTENGVWLFFKQQYEKRFDDKHKVDHVFIYSDMQAGHGGLYGANPKEYKGFECNGNYIDAIKLIERHRKEVNKSLNVFTIQTAGYDNSLIPETLNRTCVMAGWTGQEINYAHTMIGIWNNM